MKIKFIITQSEATGQVGILKNLKDLKLYTRLEKDEIKEKALEYFNPPKKNIPNKQLELFRDWEDFHVIDSVLCMKLYFVTVDEDEKQDERAIMIFNGEEIDLENTKKDFYFDKKVEVKKIKEAKKETNKMVKELHNYF